MFTTNQGQTSTGQSKTISDLNEVNNG